jgi:hypothetical protein
MEMFRVLVLLGFIASALAMALPDGKTYNFYFLFCGVISSRFYLSGR